MNTVISKDGTSIAFDQKGTGPALILVGGATQYRAIDPRTETIAELLSPNFTVIHYDRRGRGDSGDTLPYATSREVEDIEALIDHAGGLALVYGMSSGAILSLDAAAALGTKIQKLALYEPPFIVDDTRSPIPTDYVQQLKDMLAAGKTDDAIELFMLEPVGIPLEYVEHMKNDPFWQALRGIAPTLVYDGMVTDGLMLGKPLPANRWAAVTQPTIVVDGGASQPFMHHGANALADLLPDVQRRTIEDQDHDVAPELLVPVIEEFFSA